MTTRLTQTMLDRLVHELRTQDNRGTSHPLYEVLGHGIAQSVHLTRSAAREYIDEFMPILRDPEIYVSSQHGCHEWNALRIAIMEGRIRLLDEGDILVGRDGVQVQP